MRTLATLVATVVMVGCSNQTKSKTGNESKPIGPIGNTKTLKQIRSEVEKEIGFGQLNGKTYTNNYFNLKITFPDSWHINTDAEMAASEKSAKQISQNPGKKRNGIRAAWARSMTLVSAANFPRSIPTKSYNYNITIRAERMSHRPDIKTGADFLRKYHKTLLSLKKIQVTVKPILHGRAIGELPAECMPVEFVFRGNKTKQLIYATRVRDYILTVNLNYKTSEELNNLEGIRKRIQASQ